MRISRLLNMAALSDVGGGFCNTSESCSCAELVEDNGVTSGPSLGAGFLLSSIGIVGSDPSVLQ